MANQETDNRRKYKNLYIDPQFQRAILVLFTACAAMLSFLFYVAVHLGFNQMIDALVMAGITPETDAYHTVINQRGFITGFLLMSAACSISAFLFLGLRLSHRAAGAVFRFNKEVELMIEEKELHHIRLRENDFFQYMADSFNKLVDTVEKK